MNFLLHRALMTDILKPTLHDNKQLKKKRDGKQKLEKIVSYMHRSRKQTWQKLRIAYVLNDVILKIYNKKKQI